MNGKQQAKVVLFSAEQGRAWRGDFGTPTPSLRIDEHYSGLERQRWFFERVTSISLHGRGPWWFIRNAESPVAGFVTASAAPTGIGRYAVILSRQITTDTEFRTQHWFIEQFPNQWDPNLPLFPHKIRLWNRQTKAVIAFDPQHVDRPLLALTDVSTGNHSQWFANVLP